MLIDSLVKGGRERRLIELLKGFAKYPDIELALVLFSKRVEYPEVLNMGLPIYYLERQPKKDPRVFWRFFKICQKERPDIIHSWGTMPSIYAIPAAKWFGIKFINASIADAPDNLSWRDSRFLRSKFIFPFCDAVVGNSQAGLQVYQAPKHKSFCFYNGFDFSRISALEDKEQVRQRYQIPEGLVTGMVGAFFDRKDYDTFIQAAIQYLQEREDMTFLAVGDGPNLARYQAMVPERFRSRILFTGMVHRVESLVNIFDIGVLSTYTEGISNAIMEYMVLEKPVIATDGGGTKELVLDGETGYLIPTSAPDQLYDRLKKLANSEELRTKFGVNGRLRIHTIFTLDRMEKDYYQLYQQLLSNQTLSSPAQLSKLSNRR